MGHPPHPSLNSAAKRRSPPVPLRTVCFGPLEIENFKKQGAEKVVAFPHPSVKRIAEWAVQDVDGVPTDYIRTTTNFLHRDHLGSVRAITDSAGARVEGTVYKPYGERVPTINLTVAPENREDKGWLGERFDPETGLQYLNARYYDPELGLFLQPDWWEVTKPGVGTNRYGYSFGDPVNKMDPGGNVVETVWDGLNLSMDLVSLGENLSAGNYGAAAVDALGAVVDGLATGTPGVPGGAATAIRSERVVMEASRRSNEARGKLRDALSKAGKIAPAEQAHHIAEFGNKSPAAQAVRDQLEKAGIGLNEVSNGVGLSYHGGRHRGAYSEMVRDRLEGITDPNAIRAELEKIGKELKAIDKAIGNGTRNGLAASRGGKPDTAREWAADQAKKRDE